MRVPSPAASTTVRLDRAVILILKRVAPAVFNCFPPEIKPIRFPANAGPKIAADFLLMFEP